LGRDDDNVLNVFRNEKAKKKFESKGFLTISQSSDVVTRYPLDVMKMIHSGAEGCDEMGRRTGFERNLSVLDFSRNLYR
jgi:hypothetical protein